MTVTVAPVNDAPVAVNDSASTSEDTPVTTANVLLNDSDVDNALTPASISAFSQGSNGTVANNGDGTFTYTPNANFNGTDSFTYTITDAGGLASTATVTVTVAPVNDRPVPAADTNTVAEDTPAIGNVLGNDVDPDTGTNAALTVTQFSIAGVAGGPFAAGSTATIPGIGDLFIAANGDYTFTPAANFNGAVPQATYTVSDGSGAPNATATSTLDITVMPVNDPPVATPVASSGNEDTPIPVNLAGTDVEDGIPNIVTVPILPPATQGILYLADRTTPIVQGVQLTAAEAAGLVFIPTLNFNGVVTIPFTVTDSNGAISPPANAVITVNDINDPPVAIPVSPSGNEDTPIPVSLGGTDVDGTVTGVTVTSLPSPTQGVLYFADGITPVPPNTVLTPAQAAGLIFKPAPDFNGAVSIPFTVTDNDGATSPGTANITVVSVNDPPVAINGSTNTPEDTNATVSLTGTDVDGTVRDVIVTTLPDPITQGTLYLADGVTPVTAGQLLTPAQARGLVFNPAPNTNGLVTIPFITVDNNDASSTPATFVIDVGAVNDDPIATPAVVSGPEDTPVPISLTGTDIEGPIAGVTIVSLPSPTQGVLTLADGTPVRAGIPLSPAEAASLKFLPAPNFNGVVVIPFTVTDSVSQISSPPATLTVNIIPGNDPPVANNDGPIPTAPNTPVTGNVITGAGGGQADSDFDGDPLTVTQFLIDTNGDGTPETISVPSGGTGIAVLSNAAGQRIGILTISSTGAFIFTPAQAYDGPVPRATYTISDGTATDTAVLSFAPVPNTPPVAHNDGPVTTKADAPTKGNVLTGAGGGLADSDADGDKLTVTQFSIPGVGTFSAGTTAKIPAVGILVINPDGSFSFTPNTGYAGSVPKVTYTVSDGTNTDTAMLSFSPVPSANGNIGALIMLSNPTPPLFPASTGGSFALLPFRGLNPTANNNESPSHLSLYGNLQDYDLYLVGSLHNRVVLEMQHYSFSVPPGTFRHTNPNEQLEYEATKLDGSPLPSWLHFDPKQLKFTGVPPKGAMNTEVMIKAKDSYGNEAYATFKVTVNKERDYSDKGGLKLKSNNPAHLPHRHAQVSEPMNQQTIMAGKPSFNEQLNNVGKLSRLIESRALLDSLAKM